MCLLCYPWGIRFRNIHIKNGDSRMNENTKKLSLFMAWIIALAATLITLYSSEVLKFPICHLCWYQRIAIYPLTILLGIAVWRDDRNIVIYALPLLIIGALFAAYQYLEQMIPGFQPINLCRMGPSCRETYFNLFGFITFPFLSLLACIVMAVLLLIAKKK